MLTSPSQNFFAGNNVNKIITKQNLVLLSVVFLFTFSTTTNSADGAIFMEYGDIKGDVMVDGFEDTIACESIQWGVSRSFSDIGGAGGARDRSAPSFSEISCSKELDISSLNLFAQAVSGTTTDKVIISFVATGETKQVFLEYRLTNVLVSSYSTSGSADDRPSESLTFNFEKLETIFTPFDSKSKPGSTLTECWDIVKSTNCKTVSTPPPKPDPDPGTEETDVDGDGITAAIDTDPDEFSNDFNDGTTFGRILTRGEQTLLISDLPNPEGVKVEVVEPPGSIAAIVEVCGGLSIGTFDTVGQTGTFDCGSVTWNIVSGTVLVTFTDTDGITTIATLDESEGVFFDQEGTYEITALSGTVELEFTTEDGNTVLASVPPGNTIIFDSDNSNFSTPGDNPGVVTLEVDDGPPTPLPPGSDETVDDTPPELLLDDITVEAEGPDGAIVEYTAIAIDSVDPDPDVVCTPVSGSLFPLGITTVDCTATDDFGNVGADSFDVDVVDTTPPDLTDPDDITEEATSADGATVDYADPTATDDVDPAPIVECDPPSGSTFPLGETTVTCTATDASGNTSEVTFTVTTVRVDADEDGVPAGSGPDDDCDDNDPNNYPGNLEVQDVQDNDCDGLVDEQVTVVGILNTIWGSTDHPDNPEHAVVHFLNTPDKEFRLLNLLEVTRAQGGPFEFLRETIVVTGLLFPDDDLEVRLVQGEPTGPFSHILGSHVTGSQKYLTLPCRFGDSTDVTPAPVSFFEDYMDLMDDYWREVSYENINLVGSVEEDWVNLPDPHADYFEEDGAIKGFKSASECMAAADDDVFFPDFDGINFMFNQNLMGYSWGGSKTIDIDGEEKTYAMTWMAHSHWSTTQNILGQEMGHSIGLPHESGPYDTPYDSNWDVMSTGGDGSFPDMDFGTLGVHVVAVYKDALGWIGAADVYIADMSDDQEVFIERLAEPTDLANADVYLEAQIPIGGSPTDYYTIEARKFVGFDGLGRVPDEAILLHVVDTTLDDRNAQVVDDSDNDDPNDAGARWIAGELFVDEGNNISIAIVDMTDTGFNVIINPTVADLSIEKTGPPDPVVAGTEITYTVTVDNDGPNNAQNVVVVDSLHPDLVHISDTGVCVLAPSDTLTCDLDDITNGDSDSFDIVLDIPADFVYNGGSFVGNDVTVSSDQFDDDTSNNNAGFANEVIAEADVEILSFIATETPDEVMLGDSFDVTVTKTITNNGISSPVDVSALIETSGSGVSIVPPQTIPVVIGLEIAEEEDIVEDFTITCDEAGAHQITISNEITPNDAEDPDTSNNDAEVIIDVDCVIPVKINIHPGSIQNPINLKSKGGVVPVSILSTSEGEFDLPVAIDATMIDPSSVHFGPADVLFDVDPPGGATEFHNKGHLEDSFELDETTKDGDTDLVLHFKAPETELESTDTEGCTKGQIDIGGMTFTFFGCDSFVSKPGNK